MATFAASGHPTVVRSITNTDTGDVSHCIFIAILDLQTAPYLTHLFLEAPKEANLASLNS